MIDLNTQKEAYVNARGKVVLKACPGSGKTTTIAYKLHTLIETEYKNKNLGGIACLSFTNIAKDEIKEKYFKFSNKSLSYPHLVSTIDSFINTYITLPFYYLVSGKYERPTILEDNHELDTFWIKELWTYDKTKQKNIPKHNSKENKPLIYIYKPSSIVKDINGQYTYKGNLPDSAKVDISVFNDYAKAIKTWQFKNGILTNTDSTVLAFNVLSNYVHISKAISHRFTSLIIDEAQDTSEIQHAIFDLLIANGLQNIELIGDPYQSLYTWRNAKPKVFMDKYSDSQWQGLELSDNWRSTQIIIDTYSLLRNPTDEKIVVKSKFENEFPIYILRFEKGKEIQALEKYNDLCKSYKFNHVVTRGVDLSVKLNGNSDNENYWKNLLAEKIIQSIFYIKKGNIKHGIDSFRLGIINHINPQLSYKEKKVKIQELKSNYELNSKLNLLLSEFLDFSITLSDWTTKTSNRITEVFNLKMPLDLELKQGIYSPFHKKLMSEIFVDKSTKWNFPITTIHKVKGMTLDTILLFLHKNGHSISISDIFPSCGNLTDNQTMIYVAMSRPKYILAIAIEDTVNTIEITNKLGDKIEFR